MNQLFQDESSSDSSSDDDSVGGAPSASAAAPKKEEEEESSAEEDAGEAPGAKPDDGEGGGDGKDEDEDEKSNDGGGEGGDGGGGDEKSSSEEKKKEGGEDGEGEKKSADEGEGGEGGGESKRRTLEDSDDSDAEFDDAHHGGVTGRAATDAERAERERKEGEKQRLAEARAARGGEDGGGGDDLGGGGGGGSPAGRAPRPERQPPRRMGVLDIPRPDQLKKSAKLHMHVTKLPNFVGIQPEAYDPSTYDAKLEEEEYRGYVHNMIRWRYKRDGAGSNGRYKRDEHGKLARESNARFVKWSDGSYTLHVGTETFEVDNLRSKVSQPGFAGLNGYLYLSQKATDPEKGGENAEDGGGAGVAGPTVLECMGRIQSKLIPRPSSLHSEAHKNLTLAVRQRAVKKARIAEYVTQVDPEKEKEMRIRNKEDLNRQAARGGGGGNRRGGQRRRVNRRYEADEEHYDTGNLRDIKYRNRTDDMADYGDESDDDAEDEWSKRKKIGFQRGSRRRPLGAYAESASSDSEEDDDDGGAGGGMGGGEEDAAFGEDSSDDDGLAKIKAARNKKRSHHQAVVDEDDD
eukprot:CAMPEP_0113558972 /NCGR_PEP_ID=MMETSP0015_2-20120614/18644_1 /TAXON_ID=2838 /ORGANISM="Odontella" /LENGTH=573 /DNA_ID=CAMNT_0000460569 /DNA_START=173 /DNA_END=1894 /DNA_ORIENTATION=- /assembly_acc=CAM_ASM_000160